MTEKEKIDKLNENATLRYGIKVFETDVSNEVWGCTDPLAANYCNTCTIDDGTCYYLASSGGSQ